MTAEVGKHLVGKTFNDVEAGCSFTDQFLADGLHPCKHASHATVGQFNRNIKAARQHIILCTCMG